MKIHIMSVGIAPDYLQYKEKIPVLGSELGAAQLFDGTFGFTPETMPLKQMIKNGADCAIAIRSKRIAKDEEEQIRATLRQMRKWMEVGEKVILDESFEGAVRQCIGVLNSTKEDDELFIHIGGGERHIALALLYATFFVKRRMQIVVTEKREGARTETLPAVPMPFSLSPAQISVLGAAGKGRKLKGVVGALKGEKKDYPRVYRHLDNLTKMGLVSFDQEEKEYAQTLFGRLLIESQTGCLGPAPAAKGLKRFCPESQNTG